MVDPLIGRTAMGSQALRIPVFPELRWQAKRMESQKVAREFAREQDNIQTSAETRFLLRNP